MYYEATEKAIEPVALTGPLASETIPLLTKGLEGNTEHSAYPKKRLEEEVKTEIKESD